MLQKNHTNGANKEGTISVWSSGARCDGIGGGGGAHKIENSSPGAKFLMRALMMEFFCESWIFGQPAAGCDRPGGFDNDDDDDDDKGVRL